MMQRGWRMRKYQIILIGVLAVSIIFLSILCPAQEIITNPAKPLNEKPGRILKLIEVLRIKGEGKGYFFNSPREFQIISNGNLVFSDSWTSRQRAHLMMFSPGGDFLNDVLKVGEGPGEIQSGFDFSASDSEVFLYDFAKRKVVVINMKGDFIKEWSNKDERFEELIGVYGERIVARKTIRPTERKKSRLYEEKDVLLSVAIDGESMKDIFTFTKQKFYISPSQGGGMMHWDPFISTIGKGKIFVCNSREYSIEVLDLESRRITHRFSREYEQVEHQKEDWEDKFVKDYKAPRIRFEQDIEALFDNEGMLWVRTSTLDDEKGTLFDIFNHSGIYTDSFYIGIKGRVLSVDGDFVYISERDEDYLPYIVKYKIAVNSPG
jgi:hypothetical protein